jgi:hypothetical protein
MKMNLCSLWDVWIIRGDKKRFHALSGIRSRDYGVIGSQKVIAVLMSAVEPVPTNS